MTTEEVGSLVLHFLQWWYFFVILSIALLP